jgi:hypothetical protein
MEYFRQRFIDELNDGGPVEISGFTWPSAEVFETMAKHDYEVTFTDWVEDQKQQAKVRAREFLTETRCLERFHALNSRFRNGNVLPVVGAGLSLASGFKPWGAFLLSLLADAKN